MKRVLITGGPVYGKLDSVKMVTNRFKGGLMASVAMKLYEDYDCEVTYLTTKDSKQPFTTRHEDQTQNGINVIYHDGFYDYNNKVLELAPKMDAVILGAAVANLIPKTPFEGKFPSHNYKPGDEINIPFVIAPRVVDEVKKVAPNTHLFAFKLLSNVAHETLIDAAYGIVLESKATCVFANDTNDLMTKYAVTKERGVHPLQFNAEEGERDEFTNFIWAMINDEYFTTKRLDIFKLYEKPALKTFDHYKSMYRDKFEKTYGKEQYVFGTIAVRLGAHAFLTTGRGKKELDDLVQVFDVIHDKKIVEVISMTPDYKKATLNAPLLAKLFKNHKVEVIVHYHEQCEGLPTYEYAPPGTVRDSTRDNTTSFNVEGHGCFLLFDGEGKML